MADDEPPPVRRKDIYKGAPNHLLQGRKYHQHSSSNPATYLNFNTARAPLPSTSINTTNTTNMPSEAQIAGGHKANLNNPNTSEESKQHSREVLENELSDVQSASDSHDHEKNPGNVAGGLKATLKNPRVSDEAKESAQERLDAMDA